MTKFNKESLKNVIETEMEMDRIPTRSNDLNQQEQNRFQKRNTITKVLGNGSYNCAHELGDGTVLRIGILTKRSSASTMVRRGLVNLMAFQSYKTYLGPSLLIETQPWRIFRRNDIPRDIRETWCDQLNRSTDPDDEFAFQYLENLTGGEFGKWRLPSVDSLKFTAFSLIWFVRSAQQGFQFRHHDLKGANIMIRKYPNSMTFGFQTQSGQTFRMVSDQAPVIIDYDFASTYLTRDDSIVDGLGTPEYAPPEAIVFHLLRKAGDTRSIDAANGYDWWAIGYVLLETLFYLRSVKFPNQNSSLRQLLTDAHPYANLMANEFLERRRIYDTNRRKRIRRNYISLVEAQIIARVVKGTPLSMRASDVYHSNSFEDMFMKLPGIRQIDNGFRVFFPQYFGGLMNILKGLLDESPAKRAGYMYLDAPWFASLKVDSLEGGVDFYYSQNFSESERNKFERVPNAELLQQEI